MGPSWTQRRIRRQRLSDGADDRQLLVLDHDALDGGLGGGLIDGGHRGHRLAYVADPVDGHDGAVLDGVAPVGVACPARSAPVRTATTPGIASAAAASMLTDAGVGQRRAQDLAVEHARARPCHRRSSASPRSFSAASTRGMERPTCGRASRERRAGDLSVLTSPPPRRAPASDRLEDGAVAGAAAQVAGQLSAHGLLVGQLAGLAQGVDGQHHGRRAEATLHRRVAREGLRDALVLGVSRSPRWSSPRDRRSRRPGRCTS